MIEKLKTYSFYVFLLPLFFVLHGFAENIHIIRFDEVALLAAYYVAVAGLIYLLLRIILKNNQKAALLTTLTLAFYFFFGAIFDFLKAYSPVAFIYKYSVLFPVFIVLLFCTGFLLKRTTRPFPRFTLFLNALLLIYLAVDIATVILTSLRPEPANSYNIIGKIPDTCAKPDIYLLVFDEYASSLSLQQRFNFHNDLDSTLISRGFKVMPQSHSNYHATPFSMASMLNLKYLVVSNVRYREDEYAGAIKQVSENISTRFLEDNGYEIVNHSVFDLGKHLSRINQSFLPLGTQFITANTFSGRIIKDFRWYIAENKFLGPLTGSKSLKTDPDFSLQVIENVKTTAATNSSRPRFIYGHIYMPHEPFVYDRYGNERTESTMFKNSPGFTPAVYLDYLQYTNEHIKKIVDTIQRCSGNAAVIIVMGDHGFRTGNNHKDFFPNFNAVYLPHHNYEQFYDSMTNVNEFRALFNTLFHSNLPMQKDSSIFMRSINFYR